MCRGSPRWPVAAEDVRNLQHEALQRVGLLGGQTVQRTGDLVQQVGSHLDVERGVLKLGVAGQNLDYADVDLLFEEMCRETVAQGMHGYTLVDVRGFGGGMNGAVQLSRAQLGPGNSHPPSNILPCARAMRHHTRSRSSSTGESMA